MLPPHAKTPSRTRITRLAFASAIALLGTGLSAVATPTTHSASAVPVCSSTGVSNTSNYETDTIYQV